jgi:hypothetical protein
MTSRPTLRAGGVPGRRVSFATSCTGTCVDGSATRRSWSASSTTRRLVMPLPHESHHLLAAVITLAPSRPENGHWLSCPSGSAARSSTRRWAPTWWSSCTAKATPASPPLGRGRSSAGPTAATGWPANAPAAPIAAKPTEPTAPAGPTNPRSGRWWPMPADPTRPTNRTARSLSTPVVYVDVAWFMARGAAGL